MRDLNYHYLGGTGLKVSEVCIGTMTFGSRISTQKEVDQVISTSMDAGVNFFDTADQYVDGESEIMLGKALGEKRKQVVVASKVGYPYKGKQEFSLSRSSILDGIDGSLKRLGTDYVDIYYLHAPDYHTSLEISLEAMNDVVRQGKARYIGMSNYAAWQLCEAIHICRRNRWAIPVVSETCYNAITRDAERELIPFLKENNMGLTVFNPLAGGLLTGKYCFGTPARGTRFENNEAYQKRYWRQDNFEALDRMKKLADAQSVSLLELAFRWCLSQKQVTSVITGFSGIVQLDSNLKAMAKSSLPQDVLEECDEIWGLISGGRVQYNR